MERYKSENNVTQSSRVSKNNSLYESIKTSDLSRIKNNDNMRVIESNGKTIDIAKIKKYLEETNGKDYENKRRNIVPRETNIENNEKEIVKDYDINSVLENAKKTREIDYDRERYKKLKKEEYDILKMNIPFADEEILRITVGFLQKSHINKASFSVRDGINMARYAMKLYKSETTKDKETAFLLALKSVLGEEGIKILSANNDEKY